MPNDIPDWTAQQLTQLVSVTGALIGDKSALVPLADSGITTLDPGTLPPVLLASGAVLASFKPAAGQVIALRGQVGIFQRSGVGSLSLTSGQAPAVGNLLVAWASCSGAAPATVTPGWLVAVAVQSGTEFLTIFYKPNSAGADAPLALTAAGMTGDLHGQMAEFTGAAVAAPVDQTGTATTKGAAITVTAAASDAAYGNLVLMAGRWQYATSPTATWLNAFNNRIVPVQVGDTSNFFSDFVSNFSYGIVPAGLVGIPLMDDPIDRAARLLGHVTVDSQTAAVAPARPTGAAVIPAISAVGSWQQAFAANVNRRSVTFINNTTAPVYWGFGTLSAMGTIPASSSLTLAGDQLSTQTLNVFIDQAVLAIGSFASLAAGVIVAEISS